MLLNMAAVAEVYSTDSMFPSEVQRLESWIFAVTPNELTMSYLMDQAAYTFDGLIYQFFSDSFINSI